MALGGPAWAAAMLVTEPLKRGQQTAVEPCVGAALQARLVAVLTAIGRTPPWETAAMAAGS